jgi:hypothetical protein
MSQRRDTFERTGGYASPATPVPVLPKVPAGPAPGATASRTTEPEVTEPAPEPAEAPGG